MRALKPMVLTPRPRAAQETPEAAKRREDFLFPPLPTIPEPDPQHPISQVDFVKKYGVSLSRRVSDSGSLTIGRVAARFAGESNLYGTFPQRGEVEQASPHNALRHTIWQAGITIRHGADVAREAGWAHETGYLPTARSAILNGITDPSNLVFKSLDDADAAVDTLNNKIGRQIGSKERWPPADLKEVAIQVLHEFHENGLWVGTQQGDGTWRIARTKLSFEDYASVLKRYDSLNEHGYKPNDWKSFQKQHKWAR